MESSWSLFTTRGLVFCYLAANPDHTMREISRALGLTQWSIKKAIDDLEEAGMIAKRKDGRCNTYWVNCEAYFRHPTVSHIRLGRFIEIMQQPEETAAASR